MSNPQKGVERQVLRRLIELSPAETQRVAGGSPTLPLPPPCRAGPDPVPW